MATGDFQEHYGRRLLRAFSAIYIIMPKGQLTDCLALVGQAWCVQHLQHFMTYRYPDNYPDRALAGRSRETNDLGCWLWVGPTLKDGHKQFKRNLPEDVAAGRVSKNSGTNFLLHRVAFVAWNNRDVVYSASHLCDIPNCFNPQHICDEDMQHNSRKGCQGVILCPHHNTVIVDLCRHMPKCIRFQPSAQNINCCQVRIAAQFRPPPGAPGFASSARPSSSYGPSSSPRPASSSSAIRDSPPQLPAPVVQVSNTPQPRLPMPTPREGGLVFAEQALAADPTSFPGSDVLRYVSETDLEDDGF